MKEIERRSRTVRPAARAGRDLRACQRIAPFLGTRPLRPFLAGIKVNRRSRSRRPRRRPSGNDRLASDLQMLPPMPSQEPLMSNITRRTFLERGLAAAGAVTIAGTKSSGRVLGANDAIRIGVAGLHGRGGAHVSEYLKMKGVQITYLIDPDTRTFARRSSRSSPRAAATPDRPGRPQGARRQEPRRRFHRHAQPLALAHDDLGLPGRQGCLRREAVQPQRP